MDNQRKPCISVGQILRQEEKRMKVFTDILFYSGLGMVALSLVLKFLTK